MIRIARCGLLSLLLLVCATGALADDIFSAARRGDLFTVRHYLAEDPASARAGDETGYTALHWAAIRGHGEVVVTLLLARGAAPGLQVHLEERLEKVAHPIPGWK